MGQGGFRQYLHCRRQLLTRQLARMSGASPDTSQEATRVARRLKANLHQLDEMEQAYSFAAAVQRMAGGQVKRRFPLPLL